MPITPFHFGPGALLHSLAPRHISFTSFCAANVLIDLESLYNLVNQREPVHAFFHTYVGATLVIGAVIALFATFGALLKRFNAPNLFRWRELSLLQVGVGAGLGAYSHVVLDSVMHYDMQPLAPFSKNNVLLFVLSLDTLHLSCVALGIAGIVVLAVRWFVTVSRPS